MKNRIAAGLAAFALVLAGFVGLGATAAAPASAVVGTKVCYSGSNTYAPGVSWKTSAGEIKTKRLYSGTCFTAPNQGSIYAVCATTTRNYLVNGTIMNKGTCRYTTLAITYNVSLI